MITSKVGALAPLQLLKVVRPLYFSAPISTATDIPKKRRLISYEELKQNFGNPKFSKRMLRSYGNNKSVKMNVMEQVGSFFSG